MAQLWAEGLRTTATIATPIIGPGGIEKIGVGTIVLAARQQLLGRHDDQRRHSVDLGRRQSRRRLGRSHLQRRHAGEHGRAHDGTRRHVDRTPAPSRRLPISPPPASSPVAARLTKAGDGRARRSPATTPMPAARSSMPALCRCRPTPTSAPPRAASSSTAARCTTPPPSRRRAPSRCMPAAPSTLPPTSPSRVSSAARGL